MANQMGIDNLRLLESGDLSDVQMTCKGRVWNLHKFVLCARSQWFMDCMTDQWKDFGVYRPCLDAKDPDTLDIMFRYMYGGEITINKDENLSLEAHTKLWLHADYYQLHELRAESLRRLRGGILNTARWLWTHKVAAKKHVRLESFGHRWIDEQDNWVAFNDDLFQAVRHAYMNPAAREVQKTLVACVCALQEDASRVHISASMGQFQVFRDDMLAILARIRFSPTWAATPPHNDRSIMSDGLAWECEQCHCTLQSKGEDNRGVVFNPFKFDEWCLDCGVGMVDLHLQGVVAQM